MAAHNHKILKDAATAEISTVEEILRRWDPINVAPGAFAPSDEYDSYAPHIVSIVKSGCSIDELAAHLERLCVEVMDLGNSTAASQARSLKFAAQIVNTLRPANSPPSAL